MVGGSEAIVNVKSPNRELFLTVLPMGRHVSTRFIQMNMLIDMIHPRNRDEMMVLAVR